MGPICSMFHEVLNLNPSILMVLQFYSTSKICQEINYLTSRNLIKRDVNTLRLLHLPMIFMSIHCKELETHKTNSLPKQPEKVERMRVCDWSDKYNIVQ